MRRVTLHMTLIAAVLTRAPARQRARPLDGYTLNAVHDYIHSMYYTGVANVGYSDF